MTWIVQPLQRKAADGSPAGLWHLCANSDEGGGFVNGCDHDHPSAKEAQNCKEALIHLGGVTGFPYEEESDLRVLGVSRDAENGQALMLSLTRVPTDDELRAIHEALRRFRHVAPPEPESIGSTNTFNGA